MFRKVTPLHENNLVSYLNQVTTPFIVASAITFASIIGLANVSWATSVKKEYSRVIPLDITVESLANLQGEIQGTASASGGICNQRKSYSRLSPYSTSRVWLSDGTTANCTSPNGQIAAAAKSEINVTQIGNRIVGSLSVNGSVEAPIPQLFGMAKASSVSRLRVNQYVRQPSGQFQFIPFLQIDGSVQIPTATTSKIDYQVAYQAKDRHTGKIISKGDFIKIDSNQEGNINLEKDSIDFVGVKSGNIQIKAPGIYSSKKGNLVAKFERGCLVKAEADGIFKGWLPAVGTCGDFSINKSTAPNFGNVNLDYKLPDFGKKVDFTLDIRG